VASMHRSTADQCQGLPRLPARSSRVEQPPRLLWWKGEADRERDAAARGGLNSGPLRHAWTGRGTWRTRYGAKAVKAG
jgi:hypothetical protein